MKTDPSTGPAASSPDAGRRRLLARSGWLAAHAALGAAGWLGLRQPVQAADYRALVVVFLAGGNDGHNVLVPTDGAYGDYQRARANLALPRSSLVALPGTSAGHGFGLHPALAPLAPLYARGRLAFVANVGPLVQPTSAEQVRAGTALLPPALMSHSDQAQVAFGWTGTEDRSGWAGRALEALPPSLRSPLSAVVTQGEEQVVRGRQTAPASFRFIGHRNIGISSQPSFPSDDAATPLVLDLAAWQSDNAYLNDYNRNLRRVIETTRAFSLAEQRAPALTQDFGPGMLAENLRGLARVIPVFREQGHRRQVFSVTAQGSYDTHAEQRGSSPRTQDHQLSLLAPALVAFDGAMESLGLGDSVTVLCLSEFGRTLRPSSGGGSEHAWGNHWWAIGGAVRGGQVLGQFPGLVLGGPDDVDEDRGGRHLPTTASDQVAASVLQWLGLPVDRLDDVLPWLSSFEQKTIGLLHAA